MLYLYSQSAYPTGGGGVGVGGPGFATDCDTVDNVFMILLLFMNINLPIPRYLVIYVTNSFLSALFSNLKYFFQVLLYSFSPLT